MIEFLQSYCLFFSVKVTELYSKKAFGCQMSENSCSLGKNNNALKCRISSVLVFQCAVCPGPPEDMILPKVEQKIISNKLVAFTKNSYRIFRVLKIPPIKNCTFPVASK